MAIFEGARSEVFDHGVHGALTFVACVYSEEHTTCTTQPDRDARNVT